MALAPKASDNVCAFIVPFISPRFIISYIFLWLLTSICVLFIHHTDDFFIKVIEGKSFADLP